MVRLQPGAAFTIGFYFMNGGSRTVEILGFPTSPSDYYFDRTGVWMSTNDTKGGYSETLVPFRAVRLRPEEGRYLEHAATVRMERGMVSEHFSSPEAWWEHWDRSSPQMAVASRILPQAQYEQLRDEFIGSVTAASTGEGTGCRWSLPYLLVVAAKRPSANAGKTIARQGVETPA